MDDEPLGGVARRAYREHMRRVERACEEALVRECGVLVDPSSLPWTVEASIAVPYGEVHYLPAHGTGLP